ncbi:PEP-CTERM sorting domain-containing protein [Massilia sp. CCM 8733]|uniref:PEP-CTERM sorting domain-containing protein n=1 Tax=Massilia mucilaginosa TaxID=2609282 RepID=A0ABX0NY71_9BURK|nr:PEP-CTERM sorting domain-containing protein [Massilia mucilaginosa]NHZ91822.1 PEP-CTERM sorting domain-containing protein [Massilia mucilaginosa]
MNKFAVGVVIAATLASPLLAQAQVRADASLSNFSYSLVDLLPDDGIVPSLTIVVPADYAGASQISAYLRQYGDTVPSLDDKRTQSTTRYNRDINARLDTAAGKSGASVTGTDFASLQFRTTVSTTSSVAGTRQTYASASANIVEFVLSPGTQVSFFADFNGSASAAKPASSLFREDAQIDGSFSLVGYVQDQVIGGDSKTIRVRAANGYYDASPPPIASSSERFSLTFDNNSALSSNLNLKFSLTSSADSQYYSMLPLPVPEPATTAMLLAGLGLVAGAARRRRKVQGN